MTPDNKETIDDLLHGELKLIQHRKGFRYSVDALLLANFALPLAKNKHVLDLGCGSGVVALIMAARGGPATVAGVELQADMVKLARKNARLNETRPRVRVINADVARLDHVFDPASIDLVVTNPPFRKAGSGIASPNAERAIARHEIKMTLFSWLTSARKLLAPGGSVCMVYPVSEEGRLDKTVAEASLYAKRRAYALDRPEGRRRLVLLDLRPEPCHLEELPDIPIETEQGKFSLDGYR